MSDPYERFPKAKAIRSACLKKVAQGMRQTDIARELGVSRSTVSIALDPTKAQRYTDAYNAKYPTYRNIGHQRRRTREAAGYYGTCNTCGKGLNSNAIGRTCKTCIDTAGTSRAQRVVDLWFQNATYAEIMQTLNMPKGSVCSTLALLRSAGHNIPRRKPGGGWAEPKPKSAPTIQPGDFAQGKRNAAASR